MSSSDPPFPAPQDPSAPDPEAPLEVFPADEEEFLEVLPVKPRKAPAGPPHPNFWWGLLWAVGFLIVLIGSQTAFLVVAVIAQMIATGGEPPKLLDPDTGKFGPDMVTLSAPSVLGMEVIAVALAWLVTRLVVGADWKRRLALSRPGFAQVLLALLGMPGLLVLPGLVHGLAARVLPSFKELEQNAQMFGAWPVWFSVPVIALGPALAEELFCRGFLGRGQVGHYGTVIGVLLTSFLFGLLHVDPPYILAAGVLGLWLHYVYLTSRSLPLSMFLHFLNNAAAVVGYKFFRPDQPTDLQAELTNPSNWAAALLLAAVAWALYDGRARLVAAEPGLTPWRPAHPGVEFPPPGSGTRVARPWPRWWCWVAVLLTAALFGAALTVSPP